MLLNCDSPCCDQMVAGSSAKSCHQQTCSLPASHGLPASQTTTRSYQSSPEHNDQNCDAQCKTIQDQNRNKGVKRRSDLPDGTVVLGSVSTNIAHQQVCTRTDGSCTALASPSVILPPRCSDEKCSAYSSPSPQGQAQSLVVESGHGDPGNGGGGDNCESCCDGEDYDYESILAKILDEKKLALTKSPEVIEFFLRIQQARDPGSSSK